MNPKRARSWKGERCAGVGQPAAPLRSGLEYRCICPVCFRNVGLTNQGFVYAHKPKGTLVSHTTNTARLRTLVQKLRKLVDPATPAEVLAEIDREAGELRAGPAPGATT